MNTEGRVAERFAKIGTYELYRVAGNHVNGVPQRYSAGVPRALIHCRCGTYNSTAI